MDATFSVIAIGATAQYYFAMDGALKPYAGAGIDFLIGSTSVDSPYGSQYDVHDTSTNIGFHFCGGADYPLSESMTGFGEVKYTIDDVDYFSIMAGVKFATGK